jgi:ribosomal-protein-alanine N-acetyltransferase
VTGDRPQITGMVLSEGVIIRLAREQDLEQIIALNRAALPENYMPDFFANLLRVYGDYFIAAELDGSIIGYTMCRIELGMTHLSSSPFGILKKGHIVSLAVDREQRRHGIALAMMEEALRRMRDVGLKECFLEVRETNEPAIKLYEKLGFKIVRRISGYYSDGTDGYIMAIAL